MIMTSISVVRCSIIMFILISSFILFILISYIIIMFYYLCIYTAVGEAYIVYVRHRYSHYNMRYLYSHSLFDAIASLIL